MKKLNLKEQQYKETHAMIYKTVVNLLINEDYDKLTVRKICDACGISIGNFYHHFKNKDECLNEGYYFFDVIVEQKMKEKTPFNNKKERLLYLFEIELSSINDRGWKHASQLFEKQLQFDNPSIIDEERYFYKELIQTTRDYKEIYNIETDAEVIVRELLRISRGCIYDWCLHKGSYNLVQDTLNIIQNMLKTY